MQPWPFWGPTFAFAPPGSWQLGLLNSVIGALVGSLVVRAVKWLFETGFGREALGLGDADLLMMAGAFLGWQIAVFSLFVGAFAALVLLMLATGCCGRRDDRPRRTAGTPVGGPPDARELPFGPGLAIGVVVTWFAWPWLGPRVQFPFFDGIDDGRAGRRHGGGAPRRGAVPAAPGGRTGGTGASRKVDTLRDERRAQAELSSSRSFGTVLLGGLTASCWTLLWRQSCPKR